MATAAPHAARRRVRCPADAPAPPLRAAAAALAVALLALAAPTALAFADGGYFEGARDAALVGAGRPARAHGAAGRRGRALPRRAAGRVALAGLAALTLGPRSDGWAPLDDPAWATRRARRALPRRAGRRHRAAPRRAVARAAEPALAAGALVVVGYGLLGRLLPDLVHAAPSRRAGGRLDQPLTYWNAMGALARHRPRPLRPAGRRPTRARRRSRPPPPRPSRCRSALYLTFSPRRARRVRRRASLVLLALAPSFTQLRAPAIAVEAGIIGARLTAASP